MFYAAFVYLSVCLSVCLYVSSLTQKKLLAGSLWQFNVSMDKQEMIKFWNLSVYESGRYEN